MVTTLVMQSKNNKCTLSKLASEHQDWDLIEIDDYQDAMSQIQSGKVDALAIADEVPSGDCIELVSKMREKKPEANIYVILNRQINHDFSRSIDRGLLYA